MIKVDQLSYTYASVESPTLKNLDFEIKEGEIFGFLGPSGAGKSTTQKVLYKILNDYTGQVFIDGVSLKDLDKNYFERIGVGFELPNHYLKLTGKENLDLFASFYPKHKLLNIPDLFASVGLENAINQNVEAYSKGMKMRLNFIRSIMHNPDIIFFDEPTAGLDPVNAHKIKQHIKQLKKDGKTIFITTHNMTSADELCDRVAFIVDGEIALIDQPEKLKKQYGKEVVSVELENGIKETFPIKEIGQNSAFLDFLRKEKVSRINTMEATLEEVFIKVTGKSLKL